MISIKTANESNNFMVTLILLWVFSVTLSYNILRGDHISFNFGFGPFEVSIGLSIWRKLLP